MLVPSAECSVLFSHRRYTYNLTHTLQHNMTRTDSHDPLTLTDGFEAVDDKFLWNRHLLRPAFRHLDRPSPFMLALIHGFVDQASEQPRHTIR